MLQQLTLDPINAQRDGTFAAPLQKLINRELWYSQKEKILLEQERLATFDNNHDEDKEYHDGKQSADKKTMRTPTSTSQIFETGA